MQKLQGVDRTEVYEFHATSNADNEAIERQQQPSTTTGVFTEEEYDE